MTRELAYLQNRVANYRTERNIAATGAVVTGVGGGLLALTRPGRRAMGLEPLRVPWLYLGVVVILTGGFVAQSMRTQSLIVYLDERVDTEQRLLESEPWLRANK
jgi:hypothetical protein